MKKRTYLASDTAKREICAALKGLMAQKPLTKISVTEIMRACGMARQHFYYHFEDIYDAVRWMFEEEAVALLREHEGVTLWQDGLLQLFQYLQKNRAVCLCALHSMSREHLKDFSGLIFRPSSRTPSGRLPRSCGTPPTSGRSRC